MRRLLLPLLAAFAVVAAPIAIPQTAKTSSASRKAHEQILKAYGVYADQGLQDYINELGQRIARRSTLPDAEWVFVVLDDDSINAFTTGCCFVYLHRGLLLHLNSEAELASVIGHEIAHATARHGAERMSQGLLVQAGLAAGAIAAGVSGRDSASTQALLGALGAGATLGVILPFSRLQETEADRLGLTYMARAGYDPRAARDLWVRMAEASAKMGRSTPEWMSTHPSNASRIRDIEAMLPEALAIYKPR